jgi:hypothetical protein
MTTTGAGNSSGSTRSAANVTPSRNGIRTLNRRANQEWITAAAYPYGQRPDGRHVKAVGIATDISSPPQHSQSAPPSQAQLAAALAFARCIRSHGFPSFPDPTRSGQLSHEMLASAEIDLHQPAVVQAADACVGVTHGFLTTATLARFVARH